MWACARACFPKGRPSLCSASAAAASFPAAGTSSNASGNSAARKLFSPYTPQAHAPNTKFTDRYQVVYFQSLSLNNNSHHASLHATTMRNTSLCHNLFQRELQKYPARFKAVLVARQEYQSKGHCGLYQIR